MMRRVGGGDVNYIVRTAKDNKSRDLCRTLLMEAQSIAIVVAGSSGTKTSNWPGWRLLFRCLSCLNSRIKWAAG